MFKPLHIVPHGTKINFMWPHKVTFLISVLLVVGSFALVFTNANLSSDQVGGSATDIQRYLLLGIIVVGVLVTILVLAPRLRAAVRRIVGPQLTAARQNLRR